MSEAPKAILSIGGTDYTLQFNRDAVRMLEASGQSPTADGSDQVPMTLMTTMFHAALRMHHRATPQKAQELFDMAIDEGYDFSELAEVLMKLYQAVFTLPVREAGEKPKMQLIGLDEIPSLTEAAE